MKALFEALVTRDLEQIDALVRGECRDAGPEAMRDTILRFTVLAFAPSLHSRSAMYAALAIADLLDRFEDPCGPLVECARYVSESRVPWSDAPVTEPPSIPEDFVATYSGIDLAVREARIHDAERWLASLIDAERLAVTFFDAAARHAGEESFGFSTAAVAWKIAGHFPDAARFAVLRTALHEWLHSRKMPAPQPLGAVEAIGASIRGYVLGGGQPDRFQPLLLIDAAHYAETVTGMPGRYIPLARSYAPMEPPDTIEEVDPDWNEAELAYRYAVDYAIFLQSVPLSERIAGLDVERELCRSIPAAARHSLKQSEGFAEWTFA